MEARTTEVANNATLGLGRWIIKYEFVFKEIVKSVRFLSDSKAKYSFKERYVSLSLSRGTTGKLLKIKRNV